MIKWPCLKFPPINLWSALPPPEIEFYRRKADEYEMLAMYYDYESKQNIDKFKEKRFLYYLRTGRMIE